MTSLREMRPEEDSTDQLTPNVNMEELKEKKISSQKLQIYESDMEESDSISGRNHGHNSKVCQK
jgi:hypothetical protein